MILILGDVRPSEATGRTAGQKRNQQKRYYSTTQYHQVCQVSAIPKQSLSPCRRMELTICHHGLSSLLTLFPRHRVFSQTWFFPVPISSSCCTDIGMTSSLGAPRLLSTEFADRLVELRRNRRRACAPGTIESTLVGMCSGRLLQVSSANFCPPLEVSLDNRQTLPVRMNGVCTVCMCGCRLVSKPPLW